MESPELKSFMVTLEGKQDKQEPVETNRRAFEELANWLQLPPEYQPGPPNARHVPW